MFGQRKQNVNESFYEKYFDLGAKILGQSLRSACRPCSLIGTFAIQRPSHSLEFPCLHEKSAGHKETIKRRANSLSRLRE